MSTSARQSPTVVVARRPTQGREREFQRWLRRLAAAARNAPGHVESTVQPPGPAHPDEWVIVYRFDNVDQLHDWLSSPARNKLLEQGASLVDGDSREQVLAVPQLVDPVTAVASFHVAEDAVPRFDALFLEIQERIERFDGFVRAERFDPVPGVQDDTVVVFSFDTREHLDRWLESTDRAEVMQRVNAQIGAPPTVNVLGGFAGWFGLGTDVKRWKQAAVVLLALFPTSLLLAVLRSWLLPDLGLVASVAFANVFGVIILSWLLMPWLTRRLDKWLRR